MYISHFCIENYKGFSTSDVISLSPDFNIISGRNNTGKTTLLEGLALQVSNKPHRSSKTIPNNNDTFTCAPTFRFRIMVPGKTWKSTLFQRDEFIIPLPLPNDKIPFNFKHSNDNNALFQAARDFWDWLIEQPFLPFDYECTFTSEGKLTWKAAQYPSFSLYWAFKEKRSTEENRLCMVWKRDNENLKIHSISQGSLGSHRGIDCGLFLRSIIKESIYLFHAERIAPGFCTVGTAQKLLPNSQNLAEVLSNFQSNPYLFQKFNKLVTQVLPDIAQVTARNLVDGKVEVTIWDKDQDIHRDDLAIPLSDCGTGVGQVLSLLTILVTAKDPQVIAIDEPQSFLHPGAVRKLLDVLKQHDVRHQYFISTHSSIVLNATNPTRVIRVSKDGMESKVELLNFSEQSDKLACLIDLGAKFSDVFGADNILWVEGPTEEICFPLILEKVSKATLGGTVIIGVKHTGDLEGKDAKRIYDIYNKLSQSSSLFPPAIRYIFDKEDRSEKYQQDLIRASKGQVSFLPYRLYENYLLDSEAIANTINSIEDFSTPEKQITESEIDTWIKNNYSKFETGKVEKKDSSGSPLDWKMYGHGANMLSALFDHFSEYRVRYDKKIHSVLLTKWLIENKPDTLHDLGAFIKSELAN